MKLRHYSFKFGLRLKVILQKNDTQMPKNQNWSDELQTKSSTNVKKKKHKKRNKSYESFFSQLLNLKFSKLKIKTLLKQRT